MRVLIVGGTWDLEGGKPSGLVYKIVDLKLFSDVVCFNGGNYFKLEEILNTVVDYDVVFWWANVPNELPKMRRVKYKNPKTLLVSSKFNDGSYSFPQLISKSLDQKSNLTVEFSRIPGNSKFYMRVFDPLAGQWYEGSDIEECMRVVKKRLDFLFTVVRVPTYKEDNVCRTRFFELVREYAEVFHELIKPSGEVTRYLGNCSYRCQNGFPSYRSGDSIYVSRRNVDKREMGKETFVRVMRGVGGSLVYAGDYKPSVDTPVQVELYDLYDNINYMLHTHCYIEGGVFTKVPIPCGGMQEVEEILSTDPNIEKDFYAFNLKGHGSIIMTKNIEQLENLEFYARPAPEILSVD